MKKKSTIMRQVGRPASAILLILLLMAVGSAGAGSDRLLTWTGCGITKKAFMGEIAKAYEKKTGIRIEVTGGGATRGIRFAASGKADMGGTCRHWLLDKDGERHIAEKDAELVQVAWDALVIIVHPLNPVNDISLANLKKVYDGEITSWQELGGPDKKIALITREGRQGKHSGVGYMFRNLVFQDPGYEFKAPAIKVQSTGPLEKKIEKIVIAMGIDGISSAKKSKVKILRVNGKFPSKEDIISGSYSLFRPLYIAVNKNASPQTRAALDFILSTEGQAIISRQGTVNLAEGKTLVPLWEKRKGEIGIK